MAGNKTGSTNDYLKDRKCSIEKSGSLFAIMKKPLPKLKKEYSLRIVLPTS